MALDIKTNTIEQRRHTFAHIARRFGEDRAASRYEEATLDLQPEENFYYRPTWDPLHEIYDSSRTAIVMRDWYDLSDPRQYYYGTYTISRSRMIETVERNFDFAERRGLFAGIHPDWLSLVHFYLLPLRHVEWGANMNACNIADIGSGTAVTQAAIFASMDRLGMAQVISRIGLALGGPESLSQAKEVWMAAAEWQPLRRLVEDSLVIEDWFEQLVMQFLCLDGLLFPLVYDAFDARGAQLGGAGISMVCEFMSDWQQESIRWTDAVLTRAAAETSSNRALISGWIAKWQARVAEALMPLAAKVLRAEASSTLETICRSFSERSKRLGLEPGS